MEIEFALTPLETVPPWGTGEHQKLHWYALSDAHYRFKVGSEYLLHYSNAMLRTEMLKNDTSSHPTWADYYLAHLCSDLEDKLPQILTPVPAEVAQALDQDIDTLSTRAERIWEWQEDQTLPDGFYISDWFWHYQLDNMIWVTEFKANTWLWSDKQDVFIAWDNRACIYQGIPAYSSMQGRHRVNRDVFLHNLRTFRESLFDQMAQRIEIVTGPSWTRQDIFIDHDQLRKEQVQRAESFDRALISTTCAAADHWDLILKALRETE
jgi:hypothetical protein